MLSRLPTSQRTAGCGRPRSSRNLLVSCSAQPTAAKQRSTVDRRMVVGSTLAIVLANCTPAASAKLELPNKEVDNDTSPFIQRLLKSTVENKERRYQERLEDYYRRNFKEYFQFEAGNPKLGAARGISPEVQAKITKWLEDHK